MPTIHCSAVLFDLDGTVFPIQPHPGPTYLTNFQLIDSTAAVEGTHHHFKLRGKLMKAHWTDFAGENGLDPAVILATSHGYPLLSKFKV